MAAIRFLFDTLITLYSVVLLLRLLMGLVRADFRNPIGRAIVQLSNPVILPLRRLLPPLGKLDTATCVALLLCTLLKIWLLVLLLGMQPPGPVPLLRAAAIDLAELVLVTYLISILLNALLSFVAPGNYSPAQALLSAICDPVLDPIRRVLPPIAGLDLSPLWACIGIQALLILLP